MRAALLVATAVVALSVAAAPAVPSYDPWMWLLWGREITGGSLNTVDGPAFKPLPVLAGAVLTPLGAAAPPAWVVLVRAAAVGAGWLAFRLGRRISGSVAGGVAAAVALVACDGWLGFAAGGAEPALVVLAALGAAELWAAGHRRAALACGVAAALLRVEAWPFLLVAAVVHVRRSPQDRAALVAAGAAVIAAWFVPEWLGSGDLLRSGSRARVPNPGQPALADVPALASVEAALAAAPLVALVLLLAGLVVPAHRRALAPVALAGGAWLAVVAVMAQAGFSGEGRYALPGVALLAIAGAAAGCRLATPRAAAAAAVLIALGCAPGLAAAGDVRDAQVRRADDDAALRGLIDHAGGRTAVTRCGTPYIAPLRGPLLAYRLAVARRAVEPDAPVRGPGMAFVDGGGAPAVPPAFRRVARAGAWTAWAACR